MTSHSKNLLVVVTGVSGAGKSTLVHGLLAQYKNQSPILIPFLTTREPRADDWPGEVIYVTHEEFVSKKDTLLWIGYNYEQWYGTNPDDLTNALDRSPIALVIVTPEVAARIWDDRPTIAADFLLLYLCAPDDPRELKRRLLERGTHTPDDINQRVSVAEDYEQQARRSHAPFHFILPQSIKDTRAAAVSLLDTARSTI